MCRARKRLGTELQLGGACCVRRLSQDRLCRHPEAVAAPGHPEAQVLPVTRAAPTAPPAGAGPDLLVLLPQPSDFSVSLKASGKNKHFKVQLVDNVYCIGQRRFRSMDELVEHYKKAPIFTSEHGEKLYLVRALQ